MESDRHPGGRPQSKMQPAPKKQMRDRSGKKVAQVAEAQAPASEYRHPDFIGIGAQKAGTSWLDKNLRRHPKLWLPPMKELQYFTELYIPKAKVWTTRQRREKGSKILANYMGKRSPKEWDYRHVARLADIVAGPISDDWYRRMFALAPADRICGEITPDYSMLPAEGIMHMLRLAPDVRIIFSMRDPIERGWSHIRMMARARQVEDLATLEKFAASRDQLDRANYPAIIEKWRGFIPEDRFLTIFLDEIEHAPNIVLKQVCSFLNVEYEDRFFLKAANPIHVGEELQMPSSVEAILKERLRPAYEDIARLYPEIGAAWMQRHY